MGLFVRRSRSADYLFKDQNQCYANLDKLYYNSREFKYGMTNEVKLDPTVPSMS